MAIATYDDVEIILGRSTSPTEQAQIEWWLTGAELLLRSRLGDVADLDAEIVRHVEAEAVAAKVRRAGRDETSITVSADDGSVTRRYENRMTAEDITADLWGLFGSRYTSTAYSVSVSSPLDVT